MSVIDLTAYRRALKASEQIVLDMSDEELDAIDGDLEDELELMELARQMVYPPLYCVKRVENLQIRA